MIACSGGKFIDLNQLKSELNVSTLPEQSNFPNEDGVILLRSHYTDMNIVSTNITTTEKVTVVKKLFKNIEKYASNEIIIYDNEKLKNIKACVIKPDGSEIYLKDNEFYYTSGLSDNEIFYTDNKSVKFSFPAIEKESIIAYEYTKEKYFPFVTDVWPIQSNMPTLLNKYKLSVPKILLLPKIEGGLEWDWHYKAYNYSVDKPEIKDPKMISSGKSFLDYKVDFFWDIRNIPAFEIEEMMPPIKKYLSIMKFAPSDWKSWDDISLWYYSRFYEPQIKITNEISQTANDIVANSVTEDEKIYLLYNYIKNMRYVAIELGEGGIRPTLPQIVLDRKYGDCKDKSTLLLTLLKSQNIKVFPVLILTKSAGEFDKFFPSWNFNHMILKVITSTGKSYWLDATAKYCPLGELPYQCEGRDVLVIDSNGKASIEKTPSSTSSENEINIQLQTSIVYNNKAEFESTLSFYGENNIYYRNYFDDKTENEIKEFCKSLLINDFINANIINYAISDIDSMKKGLKITFKFTVGNFVRQQDDLYFLNIDPFKIIDNVDWLIKEQRNFPLYFAYPHLVKKQINIDLAEGFTFKSLPKSQHLSSENISYSKIFNTKSPTNLVIDEIYEIKTEEILAKSYKKTKQIFENIINLNNDKMVLTKTN